MADDAKTDEEKQAEQARERIFNEAPTVSLNEKTFGQPLENTDDKNQKVVKQ